MTFNANTLRGEFIMREDLKYLNLGGVSGSTNNQTGEQRLTVGRVFDDSGTDETISIPALGAMQLDFPAQPVDTTQFTLAAGDEIAVVFTEQVAAFITGHKLRGVSGKCTWVLDTVKDPADNNLTDAQVLALPRDRLLRIANGLQSLVTPWDFDNPDDASGTSKAEYYNDIDFPLGRKIIIRWFSIDDNPVTFKGGIVNGSFFPFTLTDFQERTDDELTIRDDTTVSANRHWSSSKVKAAVDDTTGHGFYITPNSVDENGSNAQSLANGVATRYQIKTPFAFDDERLPSTSTGFWDGTNYLIELDQLGAEYTAQIAFSVLPLLKEKHMLIEVFIDSPSPELIAAETRSLVKANNTAEMVTKSFSFFGGANFLTYGAYVEVTIFNTSGTMYGQTINITKTGGAVTA